MSATRGSLRFGAFIAPFHTELNCNPTLALQQDLELVELMDRLGFDEAWIGEHHSGGVELISSPEVFIAAAAERTKRIRLGTGVASLPYHHPYMLAERMNQLDHMTRGRAMFGMGPGSLPSDAAMMGIPYESVRERMEEALSVIVPLLRGETVTKKTDWFELKNATLLLDSYTQPYMELAVTNAISPQGARWAGTYGTGMIGISATSAGGFSALASNWAIAEETAAANGQVVDRKNWRLSGPMHIAETREQAREEARKGAQEWSDYFLKVIAAALPLATDGVSAVDALTDAGLAIIGTPDDAIAQIRRLEAESGGFGCFLLGDHNWTNWEAKKRSYELFARYVIPEFNGANRARKASYTRTAEQRPEFLAQSAVGTKAAFQRHIDETGGKHIDPAMADAMGLTKSA